jgi:hypothetical protein
MMTYNPPYYVELLGKYGFSWGLESNSFSRGALEKGGAKITEAYRLYDWESQKG